MYYERLMEVTGLTKRAGMEKKSWSLFGNGGLVDTAKNTYDKTRSLATRYNNARFGDALQSDGFATEQNFTGSTPVAQEKQTAAPQQPNAGNPAQVPIPTKKVKLPDMIASLPGGNHIVNAAKNTYSKARDAIFGIKYEPPTYDDRHGPTFTPPKPGTMTPTTQPAINVEPDIPGVTDVPAPAPGAPAIDMRSITGQFGTTPQQLTQTQVTPTEATLPLQQEPNIISDIMAMKVQQPQPLQLQSQPLQPQYGYTMNDLNKLTSADAAKYSKHFGRGGYNANSINDRMKLQMLRNGVNPNASDFQSQLNQNLKTMGFNRTRNARRANQQLTNLGFKRAQ